MAMKRCWLLKTDPDAFSISDLVRSPKQTTSWDGVRNYQARNFLRDEMKTGEAVLFYHSGTNPSVVGTAHVVREGYPDHTAWDPANLHYDSKSTPEKPIWYMVDIQLERLFDQPLTLAFLRTVPGLQGMELLRKGSRLSVQPVTPEEYGIILGLADRRP